jgi:hypothetical protein
MTTVEQPNNLNLYNDIADDLDTLMELFSSVDENGNKVSFSQHLKYAFENMNIDNDEPINFSIQIIERIFPGKKIGNILHWKKKFYDLFEISYLKNKPLEECNKEKQEEQKVDDEIETDKIEEQKVDDETETNKVEEQKVDDEIETDKVEEKQEETDKETNVGNQSG